MTSRRLLRCCVAALLAFAPAPGARAQGAEGAIKVVASFSILADLARNVGGARVAVAALVGPNSDAHVYEPSPADSKRIADAALVVANGLGYEGWLDRLFAASGSKAPVAVVSDGIAARIAKDDDHDHGHGGVAPDPHAWQSVANAKRYVANIRDALSEVDPSGGAAYAANAAAYLVKLDALESEIKDAVARIRPDRRRVITSHEGFGYFQDAYGIAFLAPQGLSTEAEPSARDLARLINQVRTKNISALFLENVADPRLAREIARATGVRIGGTLYSDALTGPDGPAPTYIDLMRHNVRTLLAALTG